MRYIRIFISVIFLISLVALSPFALIKLAAVKGEGYINAGSRYIVSGNHYIEILLGKNSRGIYTIVEKSPGQIF